MLYLDYLSLESVQNLWGTRTGLIDRERRLFLSKKGGEDIFQEKKGGEEFFFTYPKEDGQHFFSRENRGENTFFWNAIGQKMQVRDGPCRNTPM